MSASAASRHASVATVRVELPGRPYDILIGRGIMGDAGHRLRALGVRAAAIVTDETVAALYAEPLAAMLAEAGLRVATTVVPPGEGSKSFGQFERVCDAILAAGIERGDAVVALGGGVVGDLAGFAAATVKRGTRLVQMPTTLLAQVDSSVGGKTGINTRHGKNLVGAFHQPALVLADTALLDTLPARELRAGYAEVLKYGLIADASFFGWCRANRTAIFAGGPARDHAVTVSCRAKADVVVRDEREEGERALLNLGHTFAHALERLVGYDGARLVHGEAVAVGLCLAFRFSAGLGLCPPADALEVAAGIGEAGLPTRIADIAGCAGRVDEIVAAMAQDKKVRHGRMTFILARGIGRSFVQPAVEAKAVRAFLEADEAESASSGA